MFKEKRNVGECPECGAYAFDFDEEQCEMCREKNEVEICENCGGYEFGYKIIEVDVSEFQKLDGGLSCLSLRF